MNMNYVSKAVKGLITQVNDDGNPVHFLANDDNYLITKQS